MSILECDIGNTRCKWRVYDAGKIIERGSFALTQGFETFDLNFVVDRIRVASVKERQALGGLISFCDERDIEPEFAESCPEAGGVINAYSEPAKLGVDRWLAAVAGFNRAQGAVLVIDAGTALKADLVAANGQHLGGYIAPGLGLMESSLLSGTDKVRFAAGEYSGGVAFGCATIEAVNAGILAAQLGTVKVAITEAKRRIPEGFAILLTGGDSEPIFQALQGECDIEVVPDLVLDGLQWVLP